MWHSHRLGMLAVSPIGHGILLNIMRFMSMEHQPIKSQPPISGWYIAFAENSDLQTCVVHIQRIE